VKARNHSRVAYAETHSEGITYKPLCGEIGMCLQVGRMGPVSEDGPRQNNSVRSEGPWGRAVVAARMAVLKRATFLRHSTENPTVEAESTKDGRKPSAATNSRSDGKALSEMLALKPERGKPAFRNFRGGDGNVGIIRSPVRAIALPDFLSHLLGAQHRGRVNSHRVQYRPQRSQ
jgi:hypothetical protein